MELSYCQSRTVTYGDQKHAHGRRDGQGTRAQVAHSQRLDGRAQDRLRKARNKGRQNSAFRVGTSATRRPRAGAVEVIAMAQTQPAPIDSFRMKTADSSAFYELIDAPVLAGRLKVPESWVRNHTWAGTEDPI